MKSFYTTMLNGCMNCIFSVNKKGELVFKLMGCEHQEQKFREVIETCSPELMSKATEAIQILMFNNL